MSVCLFFHAFAHGGKDYYFFLPEENPTVFNKLEDTDHMCLADTSLTCLVARVAAFSLLNRNSFLHP